MRSLFVTLILLTSTAPSLAQSAAGTIPENDEAALAFYAKSQLVV